MHRFLNPCLIVPVLSWVALCPSHPLAVQAAEVKALNALAVSPDGELAAVGGREGVVLVGHVHTGRLVQPLNVGHTILSLAFGPGGKTLAAGCEDHGVRVWRRSGQRFAADHSFPRPKTALAVAISPAGKWLAAGDEGTGTIYLYDLATGKVGGMLWEASNLISRLEFSADGQSLASAGVDFKIWDVRPRTLRSLQPELLRLSPEELGRRMRPAIRWEKPDGLEYAAGTTFSPDGKTLATVTGIGGPNTGGQTLSLWDVATGRRFQKVRSKGMTSVAFTPGGKEVVTGSDDGTVRVWDASSGRLRAEWSAHAKAVRSVAFVPNSGRLATVGEDGAFKLWDVRTGKLVRAFGSRTNER